MKGVKLRAIKAGEAEVIIDGEPGGVVVVRDGYWCPEVYTERGPGYVRPLPFQHFTRHDAVWTLAREVRNHRRKESQEIQK